MVVLDVIWLGVILLFAFIVAGVFVIADPKFLKRRLANIRAEPARGPAEAHRHDPAGGGAHGAARHAPRCRSAASR